MTGFTHVSTPELRLLHRGKVRDSFRVDDRRRLIVVTDRISAFDLKIQTPIPGKGAVLNRLAAFWFAQTQDIVPNHLIATMGSHGSLVLEAIPLKVEVVVRGYMAGSMSRGYSQGLRSFSGVSVPDGLSPNGRLPAPIVTPTTKEENDREITAADIVLDGLVDAETYAELERVALALFARGTERLAERGLLLADTKYEFGLVDGKVVLIDELHTPDSSRIWDRAAYAADPAGVPSLDKEYVRTYMLAERARTGSFPLVLPPEVVAETFRRYADLCARITGEALAPPSDAAADLQAALIDAGVLPPGATLTGDDGVGA